MTTYRLLRSNKETGPFTLEEIRAMSLKAYDLVWVDEKSAAWRYPGEIEELKDIAPQVEEQPFDRFFQKPSTATAEKKDAKPSPATPFLTVPARSAQSGKSVYVNLPASAPRRPLPPEPAVRDAEPAPVRPLFPPAGRSEEPFPMTAQPVTRETLVAAVPPAGRRTNLRSALTGAAIVVLFAGGFATGILINNRTQRSGAGAPVVDTYVPASNAALHDRMSTQTPPPPSVSGGTGEAASATPGATPQNTPDPARSALAAARKRARAEAAAARADSLQRLRTQQRADSLLRAQKLQQKQEAAAPEPVKTNIEDYVHLSGGKYKVGAFGGISNLQLTVSNQSAVPLDLVVVEVQYIQSNKKVFKTESLTFQHVGAGSSLSLEAPKSSRGVKVRTRIATINARQTVQSFTDL